MSRGTTSDGASRPLQQVRRRLHEGNRAAPIDVEGDGAMQSGQPLTVHTTAVLLAFGADPELADPDGRTPMDMANHFGHDLAAKPWRCRAAGGATGSSTRPNSLPRCTPRRSEQARYVPGVPAPSVMPFNTLAVGEAVTHFLLASAGLHENDDDLGSVIHRPRTRERHLQDPRQNDRCRWCTSTGNLGCGANGELAARQAAMADSIGTVPACLPPTMPIVHGSTYVLRLISSCDPDFSWSVERRPAGLRHDTRRPRRDARRPDAGLPTRTQHRVRFR